MTNSRELAHVMSGAGPRVVLVHGFTQSKSSWVSIAHQLDRTYEVVAIDLPDHAGSSDVHAQSLEDAAALVAAIGGPATYIGYSLGGRVCLTLALQSPELVTNLVLVGATPGIADGNERATRRTADNALADRLDPSNSTEVGVPLEAFLSEWLAGPLFAHLSPEQANVQARLANTTAGLARSLRTTGTGTQTPSYDRLYELAMPVLLVAGGEDLRFSAIAEAMKSAIGTNAATALIPGAGHAAPFEEPDAFCAAVIAFLSDR